MNKLVKCAVIAACVAVAQPAWAAKSVGPVNVSANVQAVENFSCAILDCTNTGASGALDVCNPTPVTSMAFGTLVNAGTLSGGAVDPNSALLAPHFFKVFCGVNVSGRTYDIKQTGGPLVNGTGGRIPDGCWVFTPIAAVDTTDDNNIADEPCGECAFGPKVSANSTNALWIDTGNRRDIVVAQAAYGVAAPTQTGTNCVGPANVPGNVIPPNQASGDYTSQVTWTMTPH